MDNFQIKRRLKIAVFLTLLILCLETAGGILANSLALLSDAAHMFMDGFALSLSWFAIVISERPSTQTKTYGYHRIEIFAAFLNGVLLFFLACGILYEAFQRFMDPREVQSLAVVFVAITGLAINLVVIYFLKETARGRDLNLKSAFYHVLGDSLASIGVIAGGVVMFYTDWYFLDALVSAGIALLLLWGTQTIISDSVHILLEGVPKGISLSEVEKGLIAIPGIQAVHELHIWSICSNVYALSAHALVDGPNGGRTDSMLEEIKILLKEKFDIAHTTIQMESISCGAAEALCELKH